MSTTDGHTGTESPVTYADASTRRVTADNGIEYAYRDLGADDVPLVLLQHFRGNLDNWDPALVDALAAGRRVVAFDNVGVAATTGRTPSTVEAMAHDAIAFLEAMDLRRVDLLGFSLGSFVAQEIVLIRPDLLRRVVLASSAPQGAAGMHGWAPDVIAAVGALRRARRDISTSSSPERTRVAKQAGRPSGASSVERLTATCPRRGRRGSPSTTPCARGAYPATRCSSESPRSSSRCSSPTGTATP
jgi:pimeloyl-ACP methyl ester carboxylesterase